MEVTNRLIINVIEDFIPEVGITVLEVVQPALEVGEYFPFC
jgi:hypothetical protein